jgi:sugar phosphate isomerase/epimerase
MIHTGLCSITFRELTPQRIVQLVAEADLDGIEWGGDVHVPHGDQTRAREVRAMTIDAGIKIVSYGSYYEAGVSEKKYLPFESVLATARELGAPNIRIWAGDRGSQQANPAFIQDVVADSLRIAEMAAKESTTVSYEYHKETLTDTLALTLELLKAVNHQNLHCYWQPPLNSNVEQNLDAIEQLSPWLSNIHVYKWLFGPPLQQLPLKQGTEEWPVYLSALVHNNQQTYALLEFVVDNSPAQFLEDARILKSWLLQIKDINL